MLYVFTHHTAVLLTISERQSVGWAICPSVGWFVNLAVSGSNQAYRAISTSQLKALPLLHLWPIDVVVFHGPQGDLVLKGASRLDAFSGYPVRT